MMEPTHLQCIFPFDMPRQTGDNNYLAVDFFSRYALRGGQFSFCFEGVPV